MELTAAYYYLVDLHASDKGVLRVFDERGSVTVDPLNLFKSKRVAFEKEYVQKFGISTSSRSGIMFALWGFDEQPSLEDARSHAQHTRPDAVYVNFSDTKWRLVPFDLHRDQEILFM
ncbi:hypothetical protein [Streptomyces sp. 5-10]|uniref:hypothetical protein n=1 Tax=Streptomyces sp. 5-10 TaxID=878925 RepID=UPI00168B305F|nr:hypothetical protein [Streptomyces sp. 5-10]MBD3004744.1 hypothetical protein [Streptomyces sp. 5-10]